MKKIVLIIFFIVLILFLQIGILPHFKVLGIFPNLILLSLISLILINGFKKTAIWWAIVAGLFLDFYSLFNIVGISVVFLLLTSYFAHIGSQNLFKKTNFLSLIIIFILTICFYYSLNLIFKSIFSRELQFYPLSFFTYLIYNLIFAIPVFYPIKEFYES